MPDQLNTTPSTGSELIQSALPTEVSEPFALPPNQGGNANGEPRARMPDQSHGRVDNIEAPSGPARQPDHIGEPIEIARSC